MFGLQVCRRCRSAGLGCGAFVGSASTANRSGAIRLAADGTADGAVLSGCAIREPPVFHDHDAGRADRLGVVGDRRLPGRHGQQGSHGLGANRGAALRADVPGRFVCASMASIVATVRRPGQQLDLAEGAQRERPALGVVGLSPGRAGPRLVVHASEGVDDVSETGLEKYVAKQAANPHYRIVHFLCNDFCRADACCSSRII